MATATPKKISLADAALSSDRVATMAVARICP